MEITTHDVALSSVDEVVDFARMLSSSAETLHSSLKRLTASAGGDTGLGYSVLTEEYALRARANILFHDGHRHVVHGAQFTQAELADAMHSVEERIKCASSLNDLLRAATDLITFASAIAAGNAKVLNFLAREFGIGGGR